MEATRKVMDLRSGEDGVNVKVRVLKVYGPKTIETRKGPRTITEAEVAMRLEESNSLSRAEIVVRVSWSGLRPFRAIGQVYAGQPWRLREPPPGVMSRARGWHNKSSPPSGELCVDYPLGKGF